MKPGAQTSEFYLVVIYLALVVGHMLHVIPGDVNHMALAGAAVAIYTAARTALKVAHALGVATDIPDLPSAPAVAPGEDWRAGLTLVGAVPPADGRVVWAGGGSGPLDPAPAARVAAAAPATGPQP